MLRDSDGQEPPDMPSPRTRARTKPDPTTARAGTRPDPKPRAGAPHRHDISAPPKAARRAPRRREVAQPSPKPEGDNAQLARSRAVYRVPGKEAGVRTSP